MEEKELSLKQQQFCKHYVENKGNGAKAYLKAFGTKKYDTAKVEAHKNLTKPNILKRIREIMEESGFNDVFVDLELKKMIFQDENLMAKLKAIAEYNKIKRRYAEVIQIQNTHVNYDLTGKTMKELEEFRKTLL